MIKIKTIVITTLLLLSVGCSANPTKVVKNDNQAASQDAEPYALPGGGVLIPKEGNTVFTMCGLPVILIIHNEHGVEIYGGENIAEKAKTIDPKIPLTIAEMSTSWNGKLILCPEKQKINKTPKKKKPREWYAGY